MDTKYDFILTNDTKLVKKKENLFFLKKIHGLKINDGLPKDYDKNIFNPLPYSKEQIIQGSEFCEQIFKSIFSDLVVILNSLNNVSYSHRAWEIILGPWLRNFIRFSYKSFEDLKYILENYNINKIYAINPDEYDLFTEDSTSLLWAPLSDEWIYSLNAKILKYLNVSQEVIYNKPINSFFKIKGAYLDTFLNEDNTSLKTISFKRKLGAQLLKLLFFLRRKNDALIHTSCLSFLNEKKLEIILGQFPQYWEVIQIKFKKFDKKLRLKINLNFYNKSQNVENFIRHILPSSLPITVIESFKDINELSIKSGYPKTPKFIFTSGAYYSDEVFKFFVAKKVEEGVPYYIGQHGNNYFTSIFCNHLTELKTCDKFISWGTKYESNVIPTFNFKTLGRKKIFKKDGNLSIICGDVVGESIHEYYVSEKDQERKAQSISYLITKLNNGIKKKTKIRIYGQVNDSRHIFYYEKYYQNMGVEIESGETNIKKFFINTRVSLFTYDSTGILENLSLNMPTLCFLDNGLKHINERNIEDYNLLIDANILFTDINKLITHLTNYWSDIDKWWLDEKTQLNINKFNSRLNRLGDKNSIRTLANILINKDTR